MGKWTPGYRILPAAITAMITTLVLLALTCLFFLHAFWDVTYIDMSDCPEGIDAKYCFAAGNWDSETYLAIITDFYSVIIAVLFAALGVLSVSAFLVIRGTARHLAEQELEAVVASYFATTVAERQIEKAIKAVDRRGFLKIENAVAAIGKALEESDIKRPPRVEDE